MRTLAGVLLLAFLLAGCSGARPGPDVDAEEVDFGDVQATDTTGVIRGIVIDGAVRPLAGVNVTLNDPPRSTLTNDAGAFGFDGLQPGTYFVTAQRAGYQSVQTSVEVAAGDSDPPIVKVLMEADPVTAPYVDTFSFTGFLSFGASVGITSVGTTINPSLSQALGDNSIWTLEFTAVPAWAQGELVWEQTQAAGGMLIWEMTQGGTNNFRGHRETAESPALAFWNTTVTQSEAENITDQGIAYRFFGGPHPALAPGGGVIPEASQCPTVPTVVLGNRNPCTFGYGLTVQQRADAYIHNFYNFAPPEGWRFTADGDPVVPD